MVNILKYTFHPIEKELKQAEWMPDYFNKGMWGIRFLGEQKVWRFYEINRAEKRFNSPVVEDFEDDYSEDLEEDEDNVY